MKIYNLGLEYDMNTGDLQRSFGRRTGKQLNKYGYLRVRYRGQQYYQHRLIYKLMGVSLTSGQHIDHINGITTDNRWENLRIVSHRQNQRNRARHRAGETSGVTWFKQTESWCLRIMCGGRLQHVGYYKDKGEACKVARFLNHLIDYYGESHG